MSEHVRRSAGSIFGRQCFLSVEVFASTECPLHRNLQARRCVQTVIQVSYNGARPYIASGDPPMLLFWVYIHMYGT